MIQLPGVTIKRDTKGSPQKIIFDYKLHSEFLEDYLDNLLIESRKDEPSEPLDIVKAKLDKLRAKKKPI